MQYCSFPPEGMTGTSGYHFEYSLHPIKIPSHLDRESYKSTSLYIIWIFFFMFQASYIYRSILCIAPPIVYNVIAIIMGPSYVH